MLYAVGSLSHVSLLETHSGKPVGSLCSSEQGAGKKHLLTLSCYTSWNAFRETWSSKITNFILWQFQPSKCRVCYSTWKFYILIILDLGYFPALKGLTTLYILLLGVRSVSFNGCIVTVGTGYGSLLFYDIRMNRLLERQDGSPCQLKAGQGWLVGYHLFTLACLIFFFLFYCLKIPFLWTWVEIQISTQLDWFIYAFEFWIYCFVTKAARFSLPAIFLGSWMLS